MRFARWIFCLVLVFGFLSGGASGGVIHISAAVSLKEALTAAGRRYHQINPSAASILFNFGATGALRAQIAQGAPADLFIAASDDEMNKAEKAGLIDPATRKVIARNQLVLIVPADSKLKLDQLSALAKSPGVHRLAIGQPRTVPAGMYAQQALKYLHLWDALGPRLIYGESVRQVLAYVERGEVDAGLVYLTDAKQAGAKVRVVAIAGEETHDPICYVAAVVKGIHAAAAGRAFIDYLVSPDGQEVLEGYGFAAAVAAATDPATMPASR